MKIKLYLPLLLIFVQQSINGSQSISHNPLLSITQAINNNTLQDAHAAVLATLWQQAGIAPISQLLTIYPATTISATSLLSNVIADCTSIGTSAATTTSIAALTSNNIYFTTTEVRVNASGLPVDAWGAADTVFIATVSKTDNPIYNGISNINTSTWSSSDATVVALYVTYLTSYKANASSDKTALADFYPLLNIDTLIDALIVDINSFIAASYDYTSSEVSDTASTLLTNAGYSSPTLYS
ncbi:hypothetical protein K9K77_00015 [Candidatus Babeliales bacterium]|nr:hypothetical protein [Candidatus Babeliales bacterium]